MGDGQPLGKGKSTNTPQAQLQNHSFDASVDMRDIEKILMSDLAGLRLVKLAPQAIPRVEKNSMASPPRIKNVNDTSIAFGLTGKYLMKRPARPHNSTWTDAREAKLKKMYNRGTAIKTIAKSFGVSDAAIRQKLERMGMLYEKKEGPTPKEKFIDELLRKKYGDR